MENNNYAITIEATQKPAEVFNAICDVTNWWSKDFEGASCKINDVFIINHPHQHYSKQQLIEVIPGKKMTWLVTASKLDWLKNNKAEWTNTKLVFEITPVNDKTMLRFTHEGLTPEKECYALCAKGWDIVVGRWLPHLITNGKPSEEMAKASQIRNEYLEAHENKNNHKRIEK